MVRTPETYTADTIGGIISEIEKQTDRGAAIIASAVAEELLELVIRQRLLAFSKNQNEALFGRKSYAGNWVMTV